MSKHLLPVHEAKAMIAAAQEYHLFSEGHPRNVAFDADILQPLAVAQPFKIRIHHAIHDGRETFVIAGHDESGAMLVAFEYGEPCPPFC